MKLATKAAAAAELQGGPGEVLAAGDGTRMRSTRPKPLHVLCGKAMLLYDKFDLPVYPVAVFSYDAPLKPEEETHTVAFPDRTVLTFSYRAIQLNRLNWRDFMDQRNPVAAAVMASVPSRIPPLIVPPLTVAPRLVAGSGLASLLGSRSVGPLLRWTWLLRTTRVTMLLGPCL